MDLDDLWLPCLITAAALPLLSAFLRPRGTGRYVLQYLRCLSVYCVVWVLVSFGFLFQSAVSSGNGSVPVVFQSFSSRDWLRMLVFQQFQTRANIILGILAACLISFALLIGTDFRARCVNTFRTGFVVYMTLDIFIGMGIGVPVAQYVSNIAFNFFGAFLLSIFAPFVVGFIIPIERKAASENADKIEVPS